MTRELQGLPSWLGRRGRRIFPLEFGAFGPLAIRREAVHLGLGRRLRLLYASVARVSEICSLTWRDAQPRPAGAGQTIVCGTGAKERRLLLL